MGDPKDRIAAVVGGTGVVGNSLLTCLLKQDRYEKIFVLTRREINYGDPRVEVLVVDFENLEKEGKRFQAHEYFCCLGTSSVREVESYRKVDYEYVLSFAHLAQDDSLCRHFLLLTSVGASPSSGIYYNRIKGEVERDVKVLDIPGIHIFRPSLLLGKREKPRIWEEIGKIFSSILSFLMIGSRGKFLAIEADKVAFAMMHVAMDDKTGIHVYSTRAMYALNREKLLTTKKLVL
ncbi:MAG: oxidoreductase [Cytophagales bacterium]|nr:oxidoreductase [Cytophagales bacterium]